MMIFSCYGYLEADLYGPLSITYIFQAHPPPQPLLEFYSIFNVILEKYLLLLVRESKHK